ncbi:transmembrane and coiled-coil domains protein 2 isoform X2 [Tribolium castaneum]|uniref:transmembrane and coiled-coil domains protein 2 isoform X2 n=1 Tax=Tribolium castaneum TaxID=7070 RepID=UPI00077DD7D7|nr:PREDICTED: transmembrane and coiled-coil domains protein 2 isoform X2 [Tribolium castaneum]XP_015833373.1 PREDICTED: transmembrane and coiled-coil domains protein 2 isoform X2 [Tribolium castaneum]|eukprot:XP_015833372.1 PREDICTED: transmembrane and coiled-coil domains protein 2 isoform X2 [Tribolium castaneum]
MQLTLLNIWRLGAMDSLHVTSQQTTGSKTSSRSTSPCRPREHHTHHAPHHTKTLSHGSDSGKSQDGGVTHSSHRPSRHRSPTTSTNRTDMEDGSHVYLDDSGPAEADNSDICYTSFFSNGSSEHVKQDDETDNIDPKISATLEQLSNKIIRVRDLIKTEQKMRDDNVNEYLKLAANADKQQVQRIKAVFEKKNQKSAQVISQLQKKLDTYQKRVHELETHGLVQSHRPPREVLRDMGQGLKNVGGNIRDGITGFSGSVMSKPREFAHLIKNKFGSADNISQLSSGVLVPFSFHNLYLSSRPGATGSEGSAANGGTGSDQGEKVHHGSATLPATLHTATSQTSMGQAHRAKFPSDEGSECSSVTSDSIGRFGRGQETGSNQDSLKALYKQLTTKQEEIEALKEKLEQMKSLPQEIQYLHAALQEERFRTERLEEQINDLTELHQNEVENLKQAMADMEEKVQYQSEERLRDIHEILEHCQTKIQKMEHQALQQQQYVTLEGLDNSNARALVVKLINILLTVLQVVLLLVATGAGIIMPFLRTRNYDRTVTVTEIVDGSSEKYSITAARSSVFTRTVSKT